VKPSQPAAPARGGSRPIGHYLVALVGVALLPALAVAAARIWRDVLHERQEILAGLDRTAAVLSLALDRQIAAYQIMLQTLAASELIDRRDFAALHALASRVIAEHDGVFISLFDRTGKQIFNTARPPDAPLPQPFREATPATDDSPPRGSTESLRRVLDTGQPSNSDVFVSLSTGKLIFTIDFPVARNSQVLYVINAGFPAEVITRLLVESEPFKNTPAIVFDRNGFIVGRWRNADRLAGHRASPEFLAGLRSGTTRTHGTATTRDGIDLYWALARSAGTGWSVAVGRDRSRVDAAVRRDLAIGLGLALAALLASAGLALALAERLRRPIVALASAAIRTAPPALGRELRTREIDQLEQALVEAAAAREGQARERESRLIAEAREAEAQDANRRKDQFIALLSHELRNPLAALRNTVPLLDAQPAQVDPDTLRRLIGIIDRQTAQLTRLVNDLLDIARVARDKTIVDRRPIDLNAVLQHAVETVQPAIEDKRHDLVVDRPPAPVALEGDFARLSQVFSNLLDNAAKFTPPGGRIGVTLRVQGGEAVVQVADTGVGIAPEFLPKLFQTFSQADVRQSRAHGGLGLGLSLARALVEAHGGTIHAESDGPGTGARFTVRLPLT
jgi:signal transduction histidine kinase